MSGYLSRRQVLTAVGGLSTTVLLAGCSRDASPTTDTPEPTLVVPKFVFCADEPAGYDDYVEQDGASYPLADTIWLYVDVRNLGSESVGEETIGIGPTGSLVVVGPPGETAIEDDIRLPTDDSAGDYEVTVTFDDRITGETEEVAERFTAETGG